MIRPPPRSTLFPSPTLFRPHFVEHVPRPQRAKAFEQRRHLPQRIDRRTGPPATAANGRSDRKSTRLNSSHGYISYAVFCLKKKNGARQATRRGRRVRTCRLL